MATGNVSARYNSTRIGKPTAAMSSTGVARVTLPGINEFGNVQVTVIDRLPRVCTSDTVTAGITGAVVTIRCFTYAGTPANARVDVLYAARPHPNPGESAAWLHADQPSAPSYQPDLRRQYSSAGRVGTVVRPRTGHYEVTFPALGVADGTMAVTASSAVLRRCVLGGWRAAGTDLMASVECSDANGNPADSAFDVAFANGGNTAADPASGPRPLRGLSEEWHWLTDASAPSIQLIDDAPYQHSDYGLDARSTRYGQGRYRMVLREWFDNFPADFHWQITAVGAPATCAMAHQTESLLYDDDVVVNVVCRDAKGNPTDAQFTIELLARADESHS